MTDPRDMSEDLLHEALLDAELAESEIEWGNELRGSLAELLRVPDGLAVRTTVGVGDALLTRSNLAMAVDLLGLGWHTLRYLVGGAGTEETT